MQNKDFHIQSHYIKPAGSRGCGKKPLYSFDIYSDLPVNEENRKWVEVQFKNTRKEIFINPLGISLQKEDMVAVEGTPGLDVGQVSLVGLAAELKYIDQQKRSKMSTIKPKNLQPKQIYRIATEVDMEKYHAVKKLEHRTMIESRQIAVDLGLDMKIGDVEYQADGTKAIFYYIAEDRVDFRQLIKILAGTFHIRVEMKQIGARQESGRIGGIGPCGRRLCCNSWMSQFRSISTQAARIQELSLSPDKLAGQCGKLKCCTTFEVDSYVEARHKLPPKEIQIDTEEGVFSFFKADILSGMITYKLAQDHGDKYVTISSQRAKELIKMNRQGIRPETLSVDNSVKDNKTSKDILTNNDLDRFDKQPRQKKRAQQQAKNDPNSSKNIMRTQKSERKNRGDEKKHGSPSRKRPINNKNNSHKL